jgi:enoyl-CoA hydratase/carnithine racemase
MQRFCAGIDLKAVEEGSEADLRPLIEKLYVGVLDAQVALAKPSIAVVNGAVRGGGMTLAISCDLIIAARSATFGYPEIDVGLVPAIHFAHLPSIIGRYRAFDLLFSGKTFNADEAAGLGLVSRVVEDESVLDEARALARVLAGKPVEALRRGRAMFRRVNDAHYRPKVVAAVDDFCAVASAPQAREAVKAFLKKRARAR